MPAWTDASRKIDGKLEVQWDGVSWTDESSRLIAASGVQSMIPIWQSFGSAAVQAPWTATFEMRNASDRYSPFNSSSPIYSSVQTNHGHGIAIRFSMGLWNGSSFDYTRVFTGYIDDMTVISTARDRATFKCIDNVQPFLQQKHSTSMATDQRVDQWLGTLATAAGVTSTDFDSGLFRIPYLWLDDENIWTEMNKAAHSEGGWIYFDQNGTLTFRNAEAWIVDSVYTSNQHSFIVNRFKDLSLPFEWRNTYNEIVVVYSPRVAIATDTIYQLPEAMALLPGEARTITARFTRPAASVNTPVANTDYTIITAAGDDISGSVSVAVTAYAQRAEIAFTNNSTTTVAIVSSFQLTGTPIVGAPVQQEKLQATDADIGDPTGSGPVKTYRLENNEYIQSRVQAAFLAEMLRDRLKVGRQTYMVNGYPAIPTLIPGHRVTVIESGSGLSVTNIGFIRTINWRYGGGSYRASYEIIDATGWFPFGDYFQLGSSLLGVSGTDKAYY